MLNVRVEHDVSLEDSHRRCGRKLGPEIVAVVMSAAFAVPLPHPHLLGAGRSAPRSGPISSAPARVASAGVWSGTVLGVHFMSASTGWIATDNPNRLLVTTDAGRTWSNVTPPATSGNADALMLGPRSGITATMFLNSSEWWIAVSDSASSLPIVIYETRNAGKKWTREGLTLPGTADALFFLNADDGWLEVSDGVATGWNPVTIYRTTNGGSSWRLFSQSPSLPGERGTRGALPGSCDKGGLSFSTPSTGWAAMTCAAGSAALAESKNGGKTWSTVNLHLKPEATTSGVVVELPVFSKGDGAFGLDAPDGGIGDVLYSTTDGGRTWAAHRAPFKERDSAFVDAISPTASVIPVGSTVYATRDAGRTWLSVRSSIDLTNFGVDFTSVATGWTWNLNQGQPALYRTVDGGQSWSKVILTR